MAGSISAQTAANILVWGREVGIPTERIQEVLDASKDYGIAWSVDASPTADAALIAHLRPLFNKFGWPDEVADRFIAKANELGPSNQLLNGLATAPNIVDADPSMIETALKQAGYTLGTVTVTADQGNHPIGKVATQSIAAAHQDVIGTAINVVVQKGQTVPAAVNVLKATWLASLASAGLVAGTETTSTHATIASGNLISCSPTGGSFVEYGSSVNYVRSTGP